MPLSDVATRGRVCILLGDQTILHQPKFEQKSCCSYPSQSEENSHKNMFVLCQSNGLVDLLCRHFNAK